MFTLAVFVGIYSYLIFGLGLVGLLTKGWILGVTMMLGVGGGWWIVRQGVGKSSGEKWDKWEWGLIIILTIQALVNLVGALGPEMGFDALWYHLTIPRIWLAEHKVFFIGGDLYYSVMPKLIDMLYVWGETPAKIIHWGFGLLATMVTYKLARKYVNQRWAMLAAAVFYGNLVVGWQSITAYVDLARTFFEVLALYLLINKQIYKSAVVLGLAISTKLLALGSLPIMLILVWFQNKSVEKIILYALISILLPLPWFIFAWINTGNPVYPIFSGYRLDWNLDFNILRLADPMSPIYVMVLPAMIWLRRKPPAVLVIYCLLSFGVWFLTPRTGGGRFLLPYLPVWSVLAGLVIEAQKDRVAKLFLVGMVVLIAVVSIGYRAVANAKYLPMILGKESKQDFLVKFLYKR